MTIKNILYSIIVSIFLLLPAVNARPEGVPSANAKDTAATEKRPTVISVQVASFKELKSAEQEVNRLQTQGLEPFVRQEPVPNKGMWYRIFVGRFAEMENATTFAQRLKDQGIISGFWIRRIEKPLDETPPLQTTIEKTDKPESQVDATIEKHPSTFTTVEMPAPVVLPQEKPVAATPPVETPKVVGPKDEPELPSPHVERKKAAEPEKDPAAPLKEKTAAKEALPRDDVQKGRSILRVQDADQDKETGKFSLGIRSSFFLAPKTEDFKIKRITGVDSQSWAFQDTVVYNALISTYRLNSAFLLEAGIERAFFSSLDLWHLSLGPKVEFSSIGMLTPYAKGSLVVGHLEWDEAPGDFDPAVGWECGFGVSFFVKSTVQIGLETAYRAIRYDYNRPSEAGVTATDNQLDFSGYALSATLSYWF